MLIDERIFIINHKTTTTMYINFIKDNTNTTAITIIQTTNAIDIKVNTSLYKLNADTIAIHKVLYYKGFGEHIIHKASQCIKELACKRNLLTASIQL